MKNTDKITRADPNFSDDYRQGIIDYYSEAGMDYQPWSQKFNMHFGYFRLGLNPFSREQMLDEMNHQVIDRLQLNTDSESQLIDLGCGVGASARYAVTHFKGVSVHGATIVPWQIDQAKLLSKGLQNSDKLRFDLMDYRALPVNNDTYDGAFAMESCCYELGKDKRAFLAEAYRVLKPGTRLVVTDGFTKGNKHSRFFNYAYRRVCDGWALEDFAGIDEFTQAMRELGYEDIRIEEASWRVAVSALYVPWVSLKYFFKTVFLRNNDNGIQMGHFVAPMYGLLMGMHRRHDGYYLVSAKKP